MKKSASFVLCFMRSHIKQGQKLMLWPLIVLCFDAEAIVSLFLSQKQLAPD